MTDRPLISVDTGGTFTDCLALLAHGERRRLKVLSSGAVRCTMIERSDARSVLVRGLQAIPEGTLRGAQARQFGGDDHRRGYTIINDVGVDAHLRRLTFDAAIDATPGDSLSLSTGEPAAAFAARLALGVPFPDPLPAIDLRLATTRGTNALLERSTPAIAFFITRGFGDLLEIGDQRRPELFALDIRKRALLPHRVVEVHERLHADGHVLHALDEGQLARDANALREQGIAAAAIALLHSDLNQTHEQRAAALLRDLGFTHVVTSSELSAEIRILPRAETALVDAALRPVIDAYLRDIRAAAPRAIIHVLTSAGGLTRDDAYHPKDSLLSGPAGGVAGAAAAARAAGFDRIISFDMGGTSTDVARYDRDFEYRFEHEVGGVRLLAPALAIETVAAGGGSICCFHEGRLRVGPESAGAEPGPACYGAGGPLTITDVNLLCGRIDAQRFSIPLRAETAQRALEQLLNALRDETGECAHDVAVLDGLRRIADERMAAAIAAVSLRRGYDPSNSALLAFGGAGGQHACSVADRLAMRTVLLPMDASLLSAVGLSCAAVERFAERQVLQTLDACADALPAWLREIEDQAMQAVRSETADAEAVHIRRRIASLRLQGQSSSLTIDMEPRGDLVARMHDRFAQRYRQMYGYAAPDKPLELVSLRVIAATPQREPAAQSAHATGQRRDAIRLLVNGAFASVPLIPRDALRVNDDVHGPAVISDFGGSLVLDDGWSARVDATGMIIARRRVDAQSHAERALSAAAQRELHAFRLESIAAEMGQMLERTAVSVNVKERLDYSCAVLSPEGELVVSAPHVPVHLGALGVCVRAVRDALPLKAGDVALTNHPAFGGSHLPDLTLIAPVHDATTGEMLGYVANRAHHAEIGGLRPGSMTPEARTLIEEGVVIPPMHILRGGADRMDAVEAALREAPHPSRAVMDNLADLRGQLASIQHGVRGLQALAQEHSHAALRAAMRGLLDESERITKRMLAHLAHDRYEAREGLDDGARIAVRWERGADDRWRLDLSGTAAQRDDALNAPLAVTRSAILYVLRVLIDQPLPLNEGMLRAIELRVPACMLNPQFTTAAAQCPAVAGGNVETSQRLVDALLKPFEIAGCSQGTMNNLIFGNERSSFYETICGGAGATASGDGASAVHTHMTNTRITDPETLERRYPVRLERFAVRRASGGAGAQRGGDGIVREITFLEPMSLSLLTQHRVTRPYGCADGDAGQCGCQRIERRGQRISLSSTASFDVQAGDTLIIETPGGGGHGKVEKSK